MSKPYKAPNIPITDQALLAGCNYPYLEDRAVGTPEAPRLTGQYLTAMSETNDGQQALQIVAVPPQNRKLLARNAMPGDLDGIAWAAGGLAAAGATELITHSDILSVITGLGVAAVVAAKPVFREVRDVQQTRAQRRLLQSESTMTFPVADVRVGVSEDFASTEVRFNSGQAFSSIGALLRSANGLPGLSMDERAGIVINPGTALSTMLQRLRLPGYRDQLLAGSKSSLAVLDRACQEAPLQRAEGTLEPEARVPESSRLPVLTAALGMYGAFYTIQAERIAGRLERAHPEALAEVGCQLEPSMALLLDFSKPLPLADLVGFDRTVDQLPSRPRYASGTS